nr:putative ribonuclease H-like domain-containing protein [Tanacetum cinerariifolium]
VITGDYSRFTWVFFLATKDETSPILKTFIIGLENQLSLQVKVIKSDNGIEFKNSDLNQFCGRKGIKREFSVPSTPKQNGIAERKNQTLIEAARTMLADSLLPIPFWAEAVDEGFLVGYSINSKAFRVCNSRTCIVQETLHVNFLENKPNLAGSGPTWLFDIDSLTRTMNYQPVITRNQTNLSASFQDKFDVEKAREEVDQQYVLFPMWSSGSTNPQNNDEDAAFDGKEHDFDAKKLESEVILSPSSSAQSRKQDDKTKKEAKGKSHVESFTRYKDLKAKFKDCSNNNSNEVNAAGSIVPTVGQNSLNSTNTFSAAGPSNVAVSPTYEKSSFIDASQLPDDPDMPELEDITYSDDEDVVGAEADFNNLESAIPVSPIPTTRIHKDHYVLQLIGDLSLTTQTRSMTRVVKDQGGTQEAYASFMDFMVYQMDVKSAFLYGTIEEEVYVCQPPGFEDPDHLDKVYKVVKALYGLHQAPRAWYETSATYLLENGFQRGTIDQTLFIKKQKGDILLVQIYVDVIIFGARNKDLCKSFEKLMKDKFQMSSIGELTFFLGLQVKQKKDGIFISQDKYVAEILRKFGLTEGKSASTPIDTEKPLLKDPDGEDVDVHTYRQANLGLWYPKDLPFDLVAYSDSDYAGASLDRKSTTGGCQFLGCKLKSWQCKKQTFVATSSTEAKYVAAASCCAQVLWIQNQLMDYGTNVVNAPREPFVVKQDHGVNSSQNPPHIDECCYKCGDALDGIFCQRCTIKVEEPKPLKKKQQVEMDKEYAIKLHVELNKDIDWDVAIDHTKEQMEKEESRAIHSINETPAQKAAKRRKLNEEVEDLKRHLEIVPDEDDDVYTEATPLARNVPVVDYEIINLNNKPYYKIIRADGTHQLYISFMTLLKNFDREDLEALWSLVK